MDDTISLSLSQPRCRSHTNESPSLFWRFRPTMRSARLTSTKEPPRTEEASVEPMEEAGDRGPRYLSPSLVRPGSARPEPGPGEKPLLLVWLTGADLIEDLLHDILAGIDGGGCTTLRNLEFG